MLGEYLVELSIVNFRNIVHLTCVFPALILGPSLSVGLNVYVTRTAECNTTVSCVLVFGSGLRLQVVTLALFIQLHK